MTKKGACIYVHVILWILYKRIAVIRTLLIKLISSGWIFHDMILMLIIFYVHSQMSNVQYMGLKKQKRKRKILDWGQEFRNGSCSKLDLRHID